MISDLPNQVKFFAKYNRGEVIHDPLGEGILCDSAGTLCPNTNKLTCPQCLGNASITELRKVKNPLTWSNIQEAVQIYEVLLK